VNSDAVKLMKIQILILSLIITNSQAQTSYKGRIDKYPIQLVTHIYSDGDARAVYSYDKFDTPIIINGTKSNDKLILYEKDAKGAIQAKLIFREFNNTSNNVIGEWINADSTRRLKITLTKQFEIDNYDETVWADRELLQPASTDEHYFNLLISKDEPGNEARVTGVKIIEKKTDRVIQTIALDCQLWGLENVSVGDFNFDGIDDFSVFEASYAGPNTSSIYILRHPNSERYFVSDFAGTSLEFDSKSKVIFERNQCCAGRSIMTAQYKVVDNKMFLIRKECFEYDEEKEEHVKVECD
jgi:hypothetical protein